MEHNHTGEKHVQDRNNQSEGNSSFAQYLSFRFYKNNLNHFTDMTRDSINNFLKSISEIEEEFTGMISAQPRVDLHDFGFNNPAPGYMEENY
jgi:catabolite regulation protein CreA